MKIDILKLIMLFAVACTFSFCKQDDIDMSNIDFSNIENLHAQPLPVIQKCVEGKWQWIVIYQSGFIGIVPLPHTFVEITSDSIIITQEEGDDDLANLKGAFSYIWKKKKVSPWNPNVNLPSFYTYVMQFNNGQTTRRWYFQSIQNDTISIGLDIPYGTHSYAGYLLSKTK